MNGKGGERGIWERGGYRREGGGGGGRGGKGKRGVGGRGGGCLVKILIVYKLVLSFPGSTKAYFAFSLISGSFLPAGICRRRLFRRAVTLRPMHHKNITFLPDSGTPHTTHHKNITFFTGQWHTAHHKNIAFLPDSGTPRTAKILLFYRTVAHRPPQKFYFLLKSGTPRTAKN